jgi:hypothetical protein
LLPLLDWRNFDAHCLKLACGVADANAENEPALTQSIDISRHSSQNRRMSVVDTAHERPESDTSRRRRERRQHCPAIRPVGHRVVDAPVRVKAHDLQGLDEFDQAMRLPPWAKCDAKTNAVLRASDPRMC